MKTNILTLLLLLFFGAGFSQNAAYEYTGRNTPSVKKERLKNVQTINDLTPELWKRLTLPNKERMELERRRQKEYSIGYYLYPPGGYASVVDYVSSEISVISNGKVLTAQSTGDQLTTVQKNMLNAADPDTDIRIKIKFRYKSYIDENLDVDREIKEGGLAVTVVPETEAEYPGGYKQLTGYLISTVFDKLSKTAAAYKIGSATVNFTINEQGRVVNVYLLHTSGDLPTDKLVLAAINKMPAWKPAKNSKGIKIKQEFSIPLGGGC